MKKDLIDIPTENFFVAAVTKTKNGRIEILEKFT